MTRRINLVKVAVFVACLVPLLDLVWRLFNDDLGANPIEALIRGLGDWALRLLLVTLAVTPLRRLTGWPWLMPLRRMLGLFAFSYAACHVVAYVAVDHLFDWAEIGADIVKRRYITFGMVAFVLLLPLAITSTKAMIKRLGGKRWQRLHRLVYGIGVLAVIHYFLMVKADIRQPLIYGGLLALLLLARLPVVQSLVQRRAGKPRPPIL